jgi:hypothetical protein
MGQRRVGACRAAAAARKCARWYPWNMSNTKLYVGGCLCGGVRYEALREPACQGYCCCRDCRKATSSGFIPFLLFSASSLRITGIVGTDSEHTIYAGSLDEPRLFNPTTALFLRDKPDWVPLPNGLAVFETMPGRGSLAAPQLVA